MPEVSRKEAFPSLAARKQWGRYAAGMVTEALYILFLSAVGLLFALLAKVIWR